MKTHQNLLGLYMFSLLLLFIYLSLSLFFNAWDFTNILFVLLGAHNREELSLRKEKILNLPLPTEDTMLDTMLIFKSSLCQVMI